jgi:hypothetical protein
MRGYGKLVGSFIPVSRACTLCKHGTNISRRRGHDRLASELERHCDMLLASLTIESHVGHYFQARTCMLC